MDTTINSIGNENGAQYPADRRILEKAPYLFQLIEDDDLKQLNEIIYQKTDPTPIFKEKFFYRSDWSNQPEELTGLMYACLRGRKRLVEFFLKECRDFIRPGAEVTTNNTQRNAVAFAGLGGYNDIVELFLPYNSAVEQTLSSNVTTAQKQLKLPFVVASYAWTHYTLYHVACANNDLQLLKIMMQTRREHINLSVSEQLTPLHLAAILGHEECVATLVENGANVTRANPKDNNKTAKDYAIQFGHMSIAAFLEVAESRKPPLILRDIPIPGEIQIFIKSLTGKTSTLIVSPTDTVLLLKEKYYLKEKVEVEAQRLIYAGKQLQNELTLQDYQIYNENTIHLVMTLLGG